MINRIIQMIMEIIFLILLVAFANYMIYLGSTIEQIILIWVSYLVITCKKNNIE